MFKSIAKVVQSIESPFLRRLTAAIIVYVPFFVIGFGLVSLQYSIAKYDTKRDLSEHEIQKIQQLYKQIDLVRSEKAITIPQIMERRFRVRELSDEIQAIRQNAPYVHWTQDFAKWTGFSWYAVNKEYPKYVPMIGHGYNEQRKFDQEYQEWKRKKYQKIQKIEKLRPEKG